MYVYVHNTSEILQALRNGFEVEDGREINVRAEFEVKHSYFDHLQHAVVIAPDYVKRCLLPDAMSFSSLFLTFGLQYSRSFFMKLDESYQLEALRMITSDSSQPSPLACPPPVILYGPFGSGKTRILARAAFEIMVNGVVSKKTTRILICAHHEQSIETFIFWYFGPIAKRQHLPFDVVLIGRNENSGVYSNMYMSMDRFINVASSNIKRLRHVLIIATYTMSLRLHGCLKSADGFFTHLFLDEAAQVREPEAIIPLVLATRNAKIVLAGDNRQVGPNILVLGEEARKFGLHISLLERLMKRYEEIGPVAASYVTKLSVNYRSHESLIALPKLFYDNLELNTANALNERSGPTGYSFVCSDSKLVPTYIDRDHPFVEACIVLEEVRSYLKVMEQMKINLDPRQICIITSTRKQLNHIRDMAYQYKEYEAARKVCFKPSFMILGHEFHAIFLSLFEPIQNDEMNAFYVKSLFNPFVFNTVITKAKFRVVAVGRLNEVQQFENDTLSHSCRSDNRVKCWHEYLSLCRRQGTLHNEKAEIEPSILPQIDTRGGK
ncbi:PREDICTED: probable helicase with zinc finger domain, partial [Amphimedon queenslandica]|uniref:RNA helicase n=2 Tax=Amphimedon queenslandica TaxID=400682 RepID=A0AAN0K1F8_AMPQE